MMRRYCFYCGDQALAESRRGGSDIVLRESRDEYACPSCVTRLQAGLPVAQESLL